MSALQFTPGPWEVDGYHVYAPSPFQGARRKICIVRDNPAANARLIAAAPDHALICWAMCVQDATWEEWGADGRGELCFAGLRHATELDEFGCPRVTAALRQAISKARGEAL